MLTEFYYESAGAGRIFARQWMPESAPRAIVQIVHGIAEHTLRYEDFAAWLNEQGIGVVAEDHMGHGNSVDDDGIVGYFTGGWFAAVEDTCQARVCRSERMPIRLPYIKCRLPRR